MSEVGNRILLFVQEGVLQANVLPHDLLDQNRFDLKTFQIAEEVATLLETFTPGGLFLDLRTSDSASEDLLKLIETRRLTGQLSALPIFGFHDETALAAWDKYQFEKMFNFGITKVFSFSIDALALVEEVQSFLGLKFRKHDRKWLNQEVVLITPQKKFKCELKIINQECIVVDGEQLPPVGINVRVKSLSAYPIGLDHFCYVLKALKPTGMLLRFTNPGEELIQRIIALPEKSTPRIPATIPIAPSEEKREMPVFLLNPEQFLAINLDQGQSIFSEWITQKTMPPQNWLAILKAIPVSYQNTYKIFSTSHPNISRAIYLNTLLQAQVQGLRKRELKKEETDLIPTLTDHEEKVILLSSLLQMDITAFLKEKNTQHFLLVNELKSEMLKAIAAMKKTLQVKEQVVAATPLPTEKTAKAKPFSPQVANMPAAKNGSGRVLPSAKQMAISLALVLITGASLFMGYRSLLGHRIPQSILESQQAKSLSQYAQQVSVIRIKDEIQWTVVLSNHWGPLSDQEKTAEKEKMRTHLRLQNVSRALFIAPAPSRNFSFAQGEFHIPISRNVR